MLSEKKIRELIKYWHEGSKGNFRAMKKLYEVRQYSECLFFGHLILEKALKALVTKNTKDRAPQTHNLSRLAELAQIDLSADEFKLLSRVNRFNMEGRYPDEKLEFYKICTKSYTDEFYKPIITLYKKLCQKTTLKK